MVKYVPLCTKLVLQTLFIAFNFTMQLSAAFATQPHTAVYMIKLRVLAYDHWQFGSLVSTKNQRGGILVPQTRAHDRSGRPVIGPKDSHRLIFVVPVIFCSCTQKKLHDRHIRIAKMKGKGVDTTSWNSLLLLPPSILSSVEPP